MLRDSCGYKLANDGIDIRAIQDWLGHVSINYTTRYTALSPGAVRTSGGTERCGSRRRRYVGDQP
jgi:site-specific recombinase XerD